MDATLTIQESERTALQKAQPTCKWAEADVRAELENILSSSQFSKSHRLSRFLRIAVEYLLDGRADTFKEYTIGIEVYERESSYDPAIDSIVRTEARRLRSKLKEYYTTSQKNPSVIIVFVAGSYVPKIHVAGPQPALSHPVIDRLATPFLNSNALKVAVLPLQAPSADPKLRELASEYTDDLVHQLSQRPGLKIFRPSAVNFKDVSVDGADLLKRWNESRVQAVIHGCVRHRPEGIAILIQIAALDGMVLWSGRFQLSSTGGDFDSVSDELSKILANGVGPCGMLKGFESTSLN
jgi:TolB-like protein